MNRYYVDTNNFYGEDFHVREIVSESPLFYLSLMCQRQDVLLPQSQLGVGEREWWK